MRKPSKSAESEEVRRGQNEERGVMAAKKHKNLKNKRILDGMTG
jgi:hypothetical protein